MPDHFRSDQIRSSPEGVVAVLGARHKLGDTVTVTDSLCAIVCCVLCGCGTLEAAAPLEGHRIASGASSTTASETEVEGRPG